MLLQSEVSLRKKREIKGKKAKENKDVNRCAEKSTH